MGPIFSRVISFFCWVCNGSICVRYHQWCLCDSMGSARIFQGFGHIFRIFVRNPCEENSEWPCHRVFRASVFLALGSNSAWNAWPCRGDLAVGTLPWSLQSLSFGHGHSFNENLGFGHLAIEVCPTCKGEGCFFSTATLFFWFVFMSIFVSACIYLYLVVWKGHRKRDRERDIYIHDIYIYRYFDRYIDR